MSSLESYSSYSYYDESYTFEDIPGFPMILMENFHGKKFCGQRMRENLNLLTVERPRKGDNNCSFGKRLCG